MKENLDPYAMPMNDADATRYISQWSEWLFDTPDDVLIAIVFDIPYIARKIGENE